MIAGPLAHVAGLPLEEGLLALAPAASVLAVAIVAPLRRLSESLRRSLTRAVLTSDRTRAEPRCPAERKRTEHSPEGALE
jgi:hypothetical protein